MIQLCLLLFAGAIHSFGQDPKLGCTTIDVAGPSGIIQPGEKFVFTGTVEGDLPKGLSFQWEISGGKIVEGQGTLKISVNADWTYAGTTITATLSVLGLPPGCPNSYSASGGLTIDHAPIQIDGFGRLTNSALRTKLDKFCAELRNNPNSQGYIILYGTEKAMTGRERLIVNSINERRFPRDRVTIVRAYTHESGKIYTKLYRIPPGADNPAP